MTRTELEDALDGLYAYEVGATGSGIRDADLTKRCEEVIAGMSRKELVRLVRDMTLNDEQIDHGGDLEEACRFADWLMDLGAPRLTA